ncbi:MAG: AmmeMemoRadiSam system radical SAM enzyme [Bacteroidota bacterium]|nr:AmmeMemoRadiSam system radical SAM enzyme [Bacteroidota bacterium]
MKQISKREFIKAGFCSLCGLALSPLLFGNFRSDKARPAESPAGDEELWKWSKESMYYVRTPRGIKCLLCPQACVLKDGEVGDCKTNISKGEKLYCLTYGNPCAVHVDPIEKKPLFHFLPESLAFSIATAGCNLACLNCQNWEISQSSPRETRNYDLPPEKVIEKAREYQCQSIAYTYSDPVAFYEYTYDTARLARKENIRNVLISAGYINQEPLLNLCKYTDAANIDLKSFSKEIYEMLNAGTLEPVLNTLKTLKDEGVWLEITNLVVPDWTDDFDMIREMCEWLMENGFQDTPLHFSRFHPTYKLQKLPPTPASSLTKAREIAISSGLHYVYIGNVPGSDGENTYCPYCGKMIMKRKGFSILEKHIHDAKCDHCMKKIEGVWES